MVWIESTTSISGFISSIWENIFSSDVSPTMNTLSLPRPIRSARSLSCVGLSSPDTYSILRERMESRFCNTSVDFPTPGSPPSSTMEPFTSPPPSTRFSSLLGIGMRGSSIALMSLTARGTAFSLPLRDVAEGLVAASTFSSTMVFHSPQAGQRPVHLAESAPHDEQNHIVFCLVLAIELPLSEL